MSAQVFSGAQVFDGTGFVPGPLRVAGGLVAAPGPGQEVRLDGGYLVPGFLDLQVNGAGGRMVDGNCTADWLGEMCAIHARLGATGILPTLITDRPEATRAVIAAGAEAARRQTPGFLGLHLEGPHLDPRRKGAHDPALIRPMAAEDLALLLEAAARLPALMVTLAPESVTPEQIARLAGAGVVVSLGHTDCSGAQAAQAMAAGASCVTHLFNAMSQLGNREPGLVGAALTAPVHAGLIADGIHVAPEAIRIAMAASDRLFLVSDAMAAAGTDMAEFPLNGRRILRRDGRLTLADGTLAGADLTLPRAVAVMVGLGTALETALAMATTRPAACLGPGPGLGPGRGDLGRLRSGDRADMLHLGADLSLRAVWRGGVQIA
jgi:N-acetylglucosamine-6-phosphate deacetylase